MFAGPNGSGKSTITAKFKVLTDFPKEYVNPDVLTQQLAGDGTSYLERSRRAQQMAASQRQDMIASKISFGFETVMSHPSKIAILHQAKRANYSINLVYVCTSDPRINVSRVAGRVRDGGHDVPTDKIISRYHRSLGLLPSALEISDSAVVYDNSTNYAKKVKFENGQPSQRDNNLPLWLKQVADDITQRNQERRSLIERAKTSRLSLQPADINAGNYKGRIIATSDHYAIQQTSKSRGVMHDLSFVKIEQNATVRIKYLQGVSKVRLQNERSRGADI